MYVLLYRCIPITVLRFVVFFYLFELIFSNYVVVYTIKHTQMTRNITHSAVVPNI